MSQPQSEVQATVGSFMLDSLIRMGMDFLVFHLDGNIKRICDFSF
ncbi:hypothetical protein NHE_0189 [Neorickettsia helminthoeca str. Oregon]|uniref:Uncharacterized protein n=1 Tax=Neorickettsia helminthoeca str. Oregon TaxID=1286528 RepID=X5HJA8_9RICK|nr:hypothetical protein NHE_0189 [Neorickettsia helminthoeca str. Oregon]